MSRTTRQLSKTQRRILQYLTDVIDERGYAPSIREIARGVSLSPSSVHAQLDSLERKGYIQRLAGRLRTVERISAGTAGSGEDDLSATQQQVLDILRKSDGRHTHQPSLEEMASMLGLSSTSSVRAALRELEKKGFVRRERGKPRAIWLSRTADRSHEGAEHSLVSVPVFEQQVAAGAPMLAGSSTAQDADYYLMFPRELVDQDQAFMVRVRGDSMRDAGILDGDLLIVHPRHMESPPPPNGTIVVASINDEITVKRLQRHDEEAYLVPANDAYRAIDGRDAVVLGTVVGVYRRL